MRSDLKVPTPAILYDQAQGGLVFKDRECQPRGAQTRFQPEVVRRQICQHMRTVTARGVPLSHLEAPNKQGGPTLAVPYAAPEAENIIAAALSKAPYQLATHASIQLQSPVPPTFSPRSPIEQNIPLFRKLTIIRGNLNVHSCKAQEGSIYWLPFRDCCGVIIKHVSFPFLSFFPFGSRARVEKRDVSFWSILCTMLLVTFVPQTSHATGIMVT